MRVCTGVEERKGDKGAYSGSNWRGDREIMGNEKKKAIIGNGSIPEFEVRYDQRQKKQQQYEKMDV